MNEQQNGMWQLSNTKGCTLGLVEPELAMAIGSGNPEKRNKKSHGEQLTKNTVSVHVLYVRYAHIWNTAERAISKMV